MNTTNYSTVREPAEASSTDRRPPIRIHCETVEYPGGRVGALCGAVYRPVPVPSSGRDTEKCALCEARKIAIEAQVK